MSVNEMVRPCSGPASTRSWQGALKKEHAMSQKLKAAIAVIGIDIGKTSFHLVGHDHRGAIVLRQKWSRGQVETRLGNLPPCLIGMEACVGAHHLSRRLQMLGHDARLMPAKYVRPYSKGQKNDFRDAEAIAEAVQRPTMKFVAAKTADQLDLQALHDGVKDFAASYGRSPCSLWLASSMFAGRACSKAKANSSGGFKANLQQRSHEPE
jgi:transposase